MSLVNKKIDMKNIILRFVALLILSFVFFPFELVAIPGANTKMLLAAIGLLALIVSLSKQHDAIINKDLFVIIIFALIVSLCGLFSVIYNHTSDYSYALYFISMAVWFSAAYVVIKVMDFVHGCTSLKLLCDYLIALCVIQCILALLIDNIPSLKQMVSHIMIVTPAMEGRLYGIDASLDVAGTRFSAVLIMITHSCLSGNANAGVSSKYILWNILAFVIITIIGNMISRTTIVGVFIALIYAIYIGVLGSSSSIRRVVYSLILVLAFCIPLLMILYRIDARFHDYMRFGFEGFFSLFETGRWETNSNNILKNMIVFPDNLKTWIIGDGYFDNPYHTDPYYIGERTGGFYMATDIGYLRFIFYFGLIGLFAFITFFIRLVITLNRRFPADKNMFIFLLLLNFIVWFKVSTDIIVVFALFLCVSKDEKCLDDKSYEYFIPNQLDI